MLRYLHFYRNQKDAEAGEAKQKGASKEPGENGYYNTKELDNNAANEKEEERMSKRRMETIDEREVHRDVYGKDRDHRNSPPGSSRGSPAGFSEGFSTRFPQGLPERLPARLP